MKMQNVGKKHTKKRNNLRKNVICSARNNNETNDHKKVGQIESWLYANETNSAKSFLRTIAILSQKFSFSEINFREPLNKNA